MISRELSASACVCLEQNLLYFEETNISGKRLAALLVDESNSSLVHRVALPYNNNTQPHSMTYILNT